jgi:hypothetical protein
MGPTQAWLVCTRCDGFLSTTAIGPKKQHETARSTGSVIVAARKDDGVLVNSLVTFVEYEQELQGMPNSGKQPFSSQCPRSATLFLTGLHWDATIVSCERIHGYFEVCANFMIFQTAKNGPTRTWRHSTPLGDSCLYFVSILSLLNPIHFLVHEQRLRAVRCSGRHRAGQAMHCLACFLSSLLLF